MTLGQPTDLDQRVVVITGAARGMGRAYVEAFVARGARVVGLDRTWQLAPPEVLALTCDVTHGHEVEQAYRGPAPSGPVV
jgi:NAD(P)-dependent dehydrogenase (short-subunit alcohol dehydrogenase family)